MRGTTARQVLLLVKKTYEFAEEEKSIFNSLLSSSQIFMAFGVDEHTFCVAVRVRRGMMCPKVTLRRLGNDGKVAAAARSEVLSYP